MQLYRRRHNNRLHRPQSRHRLLGVLLVFCAACSGSVELGDPGSPTPIPEVNDSVDPSIQASPSPDATPEPEQGGKTSAPEATPSDVTTDASTAVPADTALSEATRQADAIERVLVNYTEAINGRRAQEAYDLFTENLQGTIPIDELVDGTSTSFISRLSVSQVTFDDAQNQNQTAVVIASFRSDQDPTLGRDGQDCSIWEIQYRMVASATGNTDQSPWLIDEALALGGSPFACPVVGIDVVDIDVDTPAEPPPTPAAGDKRIVHLTLDDGPGPETQRFLDLFAEFDVEATFFVNTNRVEGREEVTRRIVADGHAIANHTHTHCNLQNPASLTPSQLCGNRTANQEIEQAQDIIEATVGFAPTCFRPPYGAQSNATLGLITSYGLQSWLWDIDTNDWRFNDNSSNYSDAQAVAELEKAANLRPSGPSEGVVILLHDGTASAPRMLGLLRTWLEGNAEDYDFRVLTGCG